MNSLIDNVIQNCVIIVITYLTYLSYLLPSNLPLNTLFYAFNTYYTQLARFYLITIDGLSLNIYKWTNCGFNYHYSL